MNDHELISRSDFFDRQFYRQHYADYLSQNDDEINHFLTVGASLGFKSADNFDPCVYKLLNPGVISSAENPLVYFLKHEKNIETSYPISYSSCFPDVTYSLIGRSAVNKIPLAEHDKVTVNEARTFQEKSIIKIAYNKKQYQLYSPPSKYLINAIRENKPIKIVRWTHGAFDLLLNFRQVCSSIQRLSNGILNKEEVINLSSRLCLEQTRDMDSKWHCFTENYLLEVHQDLSRVNTAPQVLNSVAFKGYPTKDNRPFIRPGATIENCENTRGTLDIFSKYFSPEELILDATYFKRGVFSGGFREFPKNLKDHYVLLMGPTWFSNLGHRWELNHFIHLPIHWEGAFLLRHELLQKCREVLSNLPCTGTKIPVFIFQCGSISGWLILRLAKEFPNCMYLDVGQAINAWMLDEPYNSELYSWSKVYRKPMVLNLGLEKVYKKTCGKYYDFWLASKTNFDD